MPTYYAVINKTTGDLLRCGYADFSADSSFNSSTEETRTDLTFPGKRKEAVENTDFHRWTGSQWVLVSKAIPVAETDMRYRVQSFSGQRLWKIKYYTDEIVAASGFSGFSGMGRQDEYLYSGNILLGFSSSHYDTGASAWSASLETFSTGSTGEKIIREIS